MKSPAEIYKIISNHTQMRVDTCFQSAVEMVLKLNGIVGEEEYHEQSDVDLDGQGIAPFSQRATASYHGKAVTFIEEKFPEERFAANNNEAWERGVALLAEGIYPIYSLAWPTGGHHGFVGVPHPSEGMHFVTKKLLGKAHTKFACRLELWPHQAKTEILIIRPAP